MSSGSLNSDLVITLGCGGMSSTPKMPMTLIQLPIRLIPIVFGSLTSREDLDDILAFFADKNTDKYDMVLEQTKDMIRIAIRWLNKDREDVKEVRTSRLAASMESE